MTTSQALEVLTALHTAGFSLKLCKCKLFAKTVDSLGHIVRSGTLMAAEMNLASVRRASFLCNQAEVHSSLGACNVYRHYIPDFARVAAL